MARIRALNDRTDAETNSEAEDSGGEPEQPDYPPEASGSEEDEESVPESVAGRTRGPYEPLRVAQRRGEKKPVKIVDVHRASERLARDLRWGCLETRDGRKTYVPEAGQNDLEIPPEWEGRIEEEVELKVKATVGEWANILMMPSYPTLAAHRIMTANFRQAYVEIAHDALLKRMKKAAYNSTKETIRRREEEGFSDAPNAPVEVRPVVERHESKLTLRESADGDEFCEYKKIKYIVRPKKKQESKEDYLRDVCPMIVSSTECEGAKRLWLSHITGQLVEKQGLAQECYEKFVPEDDND